MISLASCSWPALYSSGDLVSTAGGWGVSRQKHQKERRYCVPSFGWSALRSGILSFGPKVLRSWWRSTQKKAERNISRSWGLGVSGQEKEGRGGGGADWKLTSSIASWSCVSLSPIFADLKRNVRGMVGAMGDDCRS